MENNNNNEVAKDGINRVGGSGSSLGPSQLPEIDSAVSYVYRPGYGHQVNLNPDIMINYSDDYTPPPITREEAAREAEGQQLYAASRPPSYAAVSSSEVFERARFLYPSLFKAGDANTPFLAADGIVELLADGDIEIQDVVSCLEAKDMFKQAHILRRLQAVLPEMNDNMSKSSEDGWKEMLRWFKEHHLDVYWLDKEISPNRYKKWSISKKMEEIWADQGEK